MEELEVKRTIAKLDEFNNKDIPQPPVWDSLENLFFCPRMGCGKELKDPEPDPGNRGKVIYFDCYECGQKIKWL